MNRRAVNIAARASTLGLGVLLAGCGGSDSNSATTTPAVGDVTVTTFAEQSRAHVDAPVAYPQSPPIGGPHSPIWQNCGFYASPIGNENGVHSMEHGAVWITFGPDLPAADRAALKALAGAHTHVLVSPYPGLGVPVVASAWRTQRSFATFDLAAITAFVAAYGQGPQTPEPGAPCDGALGTPEA